METLKMTDSHFTRCYATENPQCSVQFLVSKLCYDESFRPTQCLFPKTTVLSKVPECTYEPFVERNTESVSINVRMRMRLQQKLVDCIVHPEQEYVSWWKKYPRLSYGVFVDNIHGWTGFITIKGLSIVEQQSMLTILSIHCISFGLPYFRSDDTIAFYIGGWVRWVNSNEPYQSFNFTMQRVEMIAEVVATNMFG